MNRISACSHYFQKLSSIHHCWPGLWLLRKKLLSKQCVSTTCLYKEGGREGVKHVFVCFHIKGERRAHLFGTLVPLQNKNRNGILPLVLCKRKLYCGSMDLGGTLFTAGCLSYVCQWRKSVSCLVGQFYWLIECFSFLFLAAGLFVLFLVLYLRSQGIHCYTCMHNCQSLKPHISPQHILTLSQYLNMVNDNWAEFSIRCIVFLSYLSTGHHQVQIFSSWLNLIFVIYFLVHDFIT